MVAFSTATRKVRAPFAGNATFLSRVLAAAAPLDVVLDDASHRSDDMIAAFEALYPFVRPDGGVYAVEDVATNYWPYYDRVRAADGLSFVEFAKRKVDELNAWNSEPRVRGARRDAFNRTIASDVALRLPRVIGVMVIRTGTVARR